MNLTDDTFIAGMRQAVAERGPDHTAGSRYMNEFGSSECIVGVAIENCRQMVPNYNGPATRVLMDSGLSDRVRWAAQAAQCVQDLRFPWADAMLVFEQTLAEWNPPSGYTKGSTGCPCDLCGEQADTDYAASLVRRIVQPYTEKAGAKAYDESLAKIKAQAVELKETMSKIGSLTADLAKIAEKPTVSIGGSIASIAWYDDAGSLIGETAFPKITVPKGGISFTGSLMQKDHALTA